METLRIVNIMNMASKGDKELHVFHSTSVSGLAYKRQTNASKLWFGLCFADSFHCDIIKEHLK